jgi:imidazolonepropionase-like amidohydrolase
MPDEPANIGRLDMQKYALLAALLRPLGASLALVLLPALALGQPAPAPAPKTVIYRGADLIDGTGAPLQHGMAIVTQGERIVAVVPVAQTSTYKAASIVDMHGQYVIPGLIDSHVHLATAPNRRFAEALLRRDIYSGITAVRDMAGDTRALGEYLRAALMDEMPSPDIYYAALMAGPQFFKDPRTAAATQGHIPGQVPWMRAITDQTDMPIAIAEAHGTGATAIKVYADLPAPLIDRIVAEAHRQGMLVWAHAAVFPASPAQVIDSGANVVSHACMLAYQASAAMPPEYHNRAPVDEDKFKGDNAAVDALFADMKHRGTILDATLYVYQSMWRESHGKTRPYCSLALAEKIAGEAHRAGVMISAGTDDPGAWDAAYPSLDDELGLLVRNAGFSPLEAIVASAQIGAMTIGQAHDMGTIAPGKFANLVFLAKNPLDDIANIRSVTLTVKRGVAYRRTDYRPITKDEANGEM